MKHELAIQILIWLSVVTTAWCSLGMLLMKDFFEKLHYMASVATVSAFALLAAVWLQEGWGQAVVKTIFVCGVAVLMNAVLTHATARAARVRQYGHWVIQPDEEVPVTGGKNGSKTQKESDKLC